MKNASCLVLIDEKEYELRVNIGTMIQIEKMSGKTFMALVKEAEQGSMMAIAQLLSVIVTCNGKPVGINFIHEMEVSIFQELFNPMIDCIISSFPSSDKKKVNVLTKVQK